ncbi:MAG: hypothetical protein BWY90_01157 [Deltaproteobacteria bacterium ADurb.BinA014]|nr:MAG: hypothetical protein BWY90_01157 [Deltaproteobacteria bacterium ADurb.BinA014]
MHFHNQAGFPIYRLFIIFQSRAVGGAHFAQERGAFVHHFRYAEFTADFYKFATRNNRLFSFRQSINHQKYRRGVIVDNQRVFGAGQRAQQVAHMVVALTAYPFG